MTILHPRSSILKILEDVVDELHYGAVYFVVFASCTSVYAKMNGAVVAGDAGRPRPWSLEGRALLDAERRLMRDTHFDTTVLRLAELYGYDRQPGRRKAGSREEEHGATPLPAVQPQPMRFRRQSRLLLRHRAT